MDSQQLSKICSQIYQTHPEVKGAKPKVQPYSDSGYLLIFQSKAKTDDGRSISHTIRVVVSSDGKIKKTTTSR